ncbi:unnamed protein product [Dibothriocephalus latus]|uniref:Uncharacterized protein n=1 Tax=Dibothriocephalus latus TaxID=60516 RepID=A0A3P6QU07_DIBLA|nr:unnamed protein product [Dibothriocephalus latus]
MQQCASFGPPPVEFKVTHPSLTMRERNYSWVT